MNLFASILCAVLLTFSVTFAAPSADSTPTLNVISPQTCSSFSFKETIPKLGQVTDDFTSRLVQNLEQKQKSNGAKNLFVSPLSIHVVLTMLLAGSASKTYDEIYKTLGYESSSLPREVIFCAYQSLLHNLSHPISLFESSEGVQNSNLFKVANSIAIRKGDTLLQPFLNNLTTHFESSVFEYNFATENHAATVAINQWVKDKTNGKIVKLFDKDLSEITVLALLNAVYFKGEWDDKFTKTKTQNRPFYGLNSTVLSVPTMNSKEVYRYLKNEDGSQIIELPYRSSGVNQSFSMFVYLPLNETSDKLLSSQIDLKEVEQKISQLQHKSLNLFIPKFKLEDSHTIVDNLKELGIGEAFSDSADFSLINGHKNLKVSDVIHKTFIEVDEEGTEAAAATGVIMVLKSQLILNSTEVHVDHPFLFFIRDNINHLTLFTGIINHPEIL